MSDFLERLADRALGHVPVLEPLALRFARGTLSLDPLREPSRALTEPPMRYRARGRAVFSLPRQDAEHPDAEPGSAWPKSTGLRAMSHGVRDAGETLGDPSEVHADVLTGAPTPATEPRLFRQLIAAGPGEPTAMASILGNPDTWSASTADAPAARSQGITSPGRSLLRAPERSAPPEPATPEHTPGELAPASAMGRVGADMTRTTVDTASEASNSLQPASREPTAAVAPTTSHEPDAAMAESRPGVGESRPLMGAAPTTVVMAPPGQVLGQSAYRERSIVESERADSLGPAASLTVPSPAGARVRSRRFTMTDAPSQSLSREDAPGTNAPDITAEAMRTSSPHAVVPLVHALVQRAAGANTSDIHSVASGNDSSVAQLVPVTEVRLPHHSDDPSHSRTATIPAPPTPGETDRGESLQESSPNETQKVDILQAKASLSSPSIAEKLIFPRPGVIRKILSRMPSSSDDAARIDERDAASQPAAARLHASTDSNWSTRPTEGRPSIASSEIQGRTASEPEALPTGSLEVQPDIQEISHQTPPVAPLLQRQAAPALIPSSINLDMRGNESTAARPVQSRQDTPPQRGMPLPRSGIGPIPTSTTPDGQKNPGEALRLDHLENTSRPADILYPAASFSSPSPPPPAGMQSRSHYRAMPGILGPSPSHTDSGAVESRAAVPELGAVRLRANTSANNSILPDSGKPAITRPEPLDREMDGPDAAVPQPAEIRTGSRALAYQPRTMMRTLRRGETGAVPTSDFDTVEDDVDDTRARDLHEARGTMPRQAALRPSPASPQTPDMLSHSPVSGTAMTTALPSRSPALRTASPASSAHSPAPSTIPATALPSRTPAPGRAITTNTLSRSPLSGTESAKIHSPAAQPGVRVATLRAGASAGPPGYRDQNARGFSEIDPPDRDTDDAESPSAAPTDTPPAIRAMSRQTPAVMRVLQRKPTGAVATSGAHLVASDSDSAATRPVRSPPVTHRHEDASRSHPDRTAMPATTASTGTAHGGMPRVEQSPGHAGMTLVPQQPASLSGRFRTGNQSRGAADMSGVSSRTSSAAPTAEDSAPGSLAPGGEARGSTQVSERRDPRSPSTSDGRLSSARAESFPVRLNDIDPAARATITSPVVPRAAHLPNDSRSHTESQRATDARTAFITPSAQIRKARSQQPRALQPRTTRNDNQTGSRGPSLESDAASEPVVRIRIGQITVHAASPPTPPPASARPKPSILSLSDYLRSREEARS
jgi:hypothetical protein